MEREELEELGSLLPRWMLGLNWLVLVEAGVNIPNKARIFIREKIGVPAYFGAELEILNKRWRYHSLYSVLRMRDNYLLYSVWCSSRP